MSARVLKFGGTSVGTPAALVTALHRAASAAREGPVVVVVSAFAGTTDAIAEALERAAGRDARYRALVPALRARTAAALRAVVPRAAERAARLAEGRCAEALQRLGELLDAVALVRRAPGEIADEALATGERLAAPVFAAGLAALDVVAEFVDAAEVIRTDAGFGEGTVDAVATAAAAERRLGGLACAVVPGFFGAAPDGRVVLLGRGGSDTSATVLGAALRAERVEIWTDVDGVLTADPRQEPAARRLAMLAYADAAAAAALGAKVLHARAIGPARAAGVPIVVRSSFGGGGGTTIDGRSATGFVVTTTADLSAWRALVGARAAGTPHRGLAAIAAVGPSAQGRAGELLRALVADGVPVAGLEPGGPQGAFVALVPEAATACGVRTLHRWLLAREGWAIPAPEAAAALAS